MSPSSCAWMHIWAKKMDTPLLKKSSLLVPLFFFFRSAEGVCVGSGRDHHCLPFSAHRLLRTEIWEGKTVTLSSPAVCFCFHFWSHYALYLCPSTHFLPLCQSGIPDCSWDSSGLILIRWWMMNLDTKFTNNSQMVDLWLKHWSWNKPWKYSCSKFSVDLSALGLTLQAYIQATIPCDWLEVVGAAREDRAADTIRDSKEVNLDWVKKKIQKNSTHEC